jgi:hypothetical protein
LDPSNYHTTRAKGITNIIIIIIITDDGLQKFEFPPDKRNYKERESSSIIRREKTQILLISGARIQLSVQ